MTARSITPKSLTRFGEAPNIYSRSRAKALPSIPASNRRTIDFFRTDSDKRRAAQDLLHILGPVAAPIVPDLVATLENTDAEIANSAVIALGSIGAAAAPAFPALLNIMANTNSSRRNNAVLTVDQIGVTNAAVIRTFS